MVIFPTIIVTDKRFSVHYSRVNTSKVRPGRPRKTETENRREQLLEHAVRLFGEQGFGGLSLETLAREAQVSLRTIYSRYGGKTELFRAVIRRYSDIFVAALTVEEGSSQPQDLETILIGFAREYLYRLTRPELVRLRAQIMAEAHRFPDLAGEFYHQGPLRTLNQLARLFAEEQAKGRLVSVDPHLLAEQFVGAVRGEHFQRLQLGMDTDLSEQDVETRCRLVVSLFLRGCQSESR